MHDPTENVRRALVEELNSDPGDRMRLETEYGKGNVWSTEELSLDFQVIGFAAPFCVVRRRGDGKLGSVAFQHHPRFYFNFQESR